MTSNTFKERYRNHLKSFKHPQYSSETELSKHVWNLKNDGKNLKSNGRLSDVRKLTLQAQIVATSVQKKNYKL